MRLPVLPIRSFLGQRSISLWLTFLLLSSIFLFGLSSPIHAQSEPGAYATNTNPDVPKDQNTLAQSVTINIMAALICQIAGVDVINPEKGCLGVDPVTRKLGYAPVSPETGKRVHTGGLIGMTGDLYGYVYNPPASGVQYSRQLAQNFGIVKHSYAQNVNDVPENERTGLQALSPLLQLWESVRNLTYLAFVLVFIIIGVGIMLRLNIDPRTVMTIQNQVPRVIIAIVLITFSYAIIGFLVDVMWLGTYIGINVVTQHTGLEQTVQCESDGNATIRERAYINLLSYPLVLTNDIFKRDVSDGAGGNYCQPGITHLSSEIGNSIGNIADLMTGAILNSSGAGCVNGFSVNVGACVDRVLSEVVKWIGMIFGFLIAFIAILIVMLRLWITLLKAYALLLVYTIVGPFWILLGLMPGSTRSFSSWIRTVVAKLAVFPAAAFLIVAARVVAEQYNFATTEQIDPSLYFVPPMVGNPNMAAFGPLIAFAILLITPEILTLMNEMLKAPSSKVTSDAVQGGFSRGLAVGAPLGLAGGKFFRTHGGQPIGGAAVTLSRWANIPEHERTTRRSRLAYHVGRLGGNLIGLRGGGGGH